MKILVLKEKHGNQVLDASTDEQFLDACLAVVKGRYGPDNHWWAFPKPEKPKLPELGLTKEQITALPETSPVRKAAITAYDNHRRQMSYYEKSLEEWETIQKCINSETPLDVARKLARRVMNWRQDYEYEGWELIEVQDRYYS